MEHNDVRDALVRFLRADVLGPQLDEEGRPQTNECLQVEGSPDGIYLIGKLHPNSDEQGVALPPILPSTTTQTSQPHLTNQRTDLSHLVRTNSCSPLQWASPFVHPAAYRNHPFNLNGQGTKTEDGWLRIPHHHELVIDYGSMMFGAYADPTD